jgi:hypothetical protein
MAISERASPPKAEIGSRPSTRPPVLLGILFGNARLRHADELGKRRYHAKPHRSQQAAKWGNQWTNALKPF